MKDDRSVPEHLVELDPALLKHRVLLFGELGVFIAGVNLFHRIFGGGERVEAALPDDSVGRFASRNWNEALSFWKNAAVLKFCELLFQGVELLLVLRVILLNKTHHNSHENLLYDC